VLGELSDSDEMAGISADDFPAGGPAVHSPKAGRRGLPVFSAPDKKAESPSGVKKPRARNTSSTCSTIACKLISPNRLESIIANTHYPGWRRTFFLAAT
jgi:hypothetical protein